MHLDLCRHHKLNYVADKASFISWTWRHLPIHSVSETMFCLACCIALVATVIYNVQCSEVPGNWYWDHRSKLLETERRMAVGGDIRLNDDEIVANKVLLNIKMEELRRGHRNESDFFPAQHFFESSDRISKQSKVFSVIRNMPKGACLHTHLTAAGSLDVVFNLTYTENLYGCMYLGVFRLRFFQPGTQPNHCHWELLKDLRSNSSFNGWLKEQLTLKVDNYEKVYTRAEDVWNKFRWTFSTKFYFISYRPVFESYVYEVLREFYMDNVNYIELRSAILPLYEINGTEYNAAEFIEILNNTIERFKSDHPGFLGVRYIYSYSRYINNDTFINIINEYIELKKQFPSFIAGFDLIGHEDKSPPLQEFVYEICKQANYINLFLHAGETNWYGFTDINLIDAILLNSTRIAHGLGLHKHPEAIKLIKQRDIALEITPISTQVLMFVNDLRNHPAAGLIAQGFSIVIGNDDPGAWGALGVSHDWYMIFMAMTNENVGLEFLKKVAMNSFVYSSMESSERSAALQLFENQWRQFVRQLKTMPL